MQPKPRVGTRHGTAAEESSPQRPNSEHVTQQLLTPRSEAGDPSRCLYLDFRGSTSHNNGKVGSTPGTRGRAGGRGPPTRRTLPARGGRRLCPTADSLMSLEDLVLREGTNLGGAT